MQTANLKSLNHASYKSLAIKLDLPYAKRPPSRDLEIVQEDITAFFCRGDPYQKIVDQISEPLDDEVTDRSAFEPKLPTLHHHPFSPPLNNVVTSLYLISLALHINEYFVHRQRQIISQLNRVSHAQHSSG